MKRPAKWKIVIFTVAFGALNLFAIAFATVKPHMAGGSAVSVSSASLGVGPVAAVRSCPDTGGNTTHPQTQEKFRLRITDRRIEKFARVMARSSGKTVVMEVYVPQR